MRKIEVVLSDERLITPSGLCMVGQAMAKSDLIKKAARMRTDKRSQLQIKNGDILLTEIGMLTLGKTDDQSDTACPYGFRKRCCGKLCRTSLE